MKILLFRQAIYSILSSTNVHDLSGSCLNPAWLAYLELKKENGMYWFDWFFIGVLIVAALALGVLRGITQIKSNVASINGLWVISLLLMLFVIMVIIAAGMLNDLLTL